MQKLKKTRIQLLSALGIICLMAVVGVGLGVKAFSSQGTPEVVMETVNIETYNEANEVEENIGAVSGPYVYMDMYMQDVKMKRMTFGRLTIASSTAGSATTLLEANLTEYSGMDFTPGDNAVAFTLPATSTMTTFIPDVGDCSLWRIRNLDATAATTTTITAGTGIDLVENENGDVIIDGGNEAQLLFCRELDTDVTVYVDEYIPAD